MLLAGLAAAFLASVLFNVGIVLQAIDARDAPKELEYRFALLGRLLGHPRWVLGLILGFVGLLPQIVAYSKAPFVVVQPMLAVGLLLVLALGVRMLGESVGARELVGVVAIIGGIALVAWGAPSHADTHRGGITVIAVVAFLALGGLAPFAVRGTRLDSGMLAIVATGFAFGAANVATKLLGDDFSDHQYANAVAWGAIGLAMAFAATITNMTAFQRRSATVVVPVSTSVQTFLPIVLEPVFLREDWSSAALGGVPIAAGLALALVGSILISSTRAVSELIADAS